MKSQLLARVALAVLLFVMTGKDRPASVRALAAGQSPRAGTPVFEVDASWPTLPDNWGMGVVSSVAVDQRDHVWILHRPRVGVPPGKTPAPPVLELDATGKFVRGWGGPASGYDWPDAEHGIYVDDRDSVWIGGSSRKGAAVCEGGRCARGDDMLLKFTPHGKFVLQVGHRDRSTGSKDPRNVHAATDVFVYRNTNELFVSDGYEGPGEQGNCRVIVFDADTGAFKRMWGAFGNVPACIPDAPRPQRGAGNDGGQRPALDTEGPGPQQFDIVHGIEVSKDGLVYVADRSNRRVQVFTTGGKYVDQVFINRAGPSDASAAGIAFSADPEQRFMYVADYGNSHVVVVERKSLRVLSQFGERSTKPGDFQGIHNLAIDSKGNLYTAEVAPGNRAQRFILTGTSTPSTR
jgi:hypothetical protein